MQIASLGYVPQIYNVNTVSRASMNPIAPISEDVTRSRVDFSGLISEAGNRQNQNPLRPGESANFADILASQFAMSAQNQARVMVPEA